MVTVTAQRYNPGLSPLEFSIVPLVTVQTRMEANSSGRYGSPVPIEASLARASSSTRSARHFENGREYHSYHRGKYYFPCDQGEGDRLDIFHCFASAVRSGGLHLAHITVENPRILDLGTGTGIWAIEMADLFPAGTIVGMDLSPMQPPLIPPNLSFMAPADFDSPWHIAKDTIDYIHLRMGGGSVRSWPRLYKRVFSHLVPDSGVFEQFEIDFEPRCDDDVVPDAARQWWQCLKGASARAHRPLEYQLDTRAMLTAAGFVDIKEQQIRAPYNTWCPEKRQREIGLWYSAVLLRGLDGMCLALMTRVFGWSKEESSRLCENMLSLVRSRAFHGYNIVHIWTARRPPKPPKPHTPPSPNPSHSTSASTSLNSSQSHSESQSP